MLSVRPNCLSAPVIAAAVRAVYGQNYPNRLIRIVATDTEGSAPTS